MRGLVAIGEHARAGGWPQRAHRALSHDPEIEVVAEVVILSRRCADAVEVAASSVPSEKFVRVLIRGRRNIPVWT